MNPPSGGFRLFCHACSSPSFPQHKRCIPASLEAYYAAQDANSRGRFYTVISHYSMAKQTTSHSVSPWLPGGAAGQQHNAKPPSGESHWAVGTRRRRADVQTDVSSNIEIIGKKDKYEQLHVYAKRWKHACTSKRWVMFAFSLLLIDVRSLLSRFCSSLSAETNTQIVLFNCCHVLFIFCCVCIWCVMLSSDSAYKHTHPSAQLPIWANLCKACTL